VDERFAFDAEIWVAPGAGAWHFVSLPPDAADQIEAQAPSAATGFGSVRVTAEIGSTSWQTSIFPDSKRATYVLPVKKAVRSAQGLTDGDTVRVTLTLI
jgi:Domain of unknown function (DUF1905)